METRLGISDPRRTKQREQMQPVKVIQHLSMACSTPWPGSKFPDSTKDSLFLHVWPCSTLITMPTRFRRILKRLTMTCGTVVAFNSFPMANQINSTRSVCQNALRSNSIMKSCLTVFSDVQTEISLSLRRVRGLICPSFQTMSGTSCLIHLCSSTQVHQ